GVHQATGPVLHGGDVLVALCAEVDGDAVDDVEHAHAHALDPHGTGACSDVVTRHSLSRALARVLRSLPRALSRVLSRVFSRGPPAIRASLTGLSLGDLLSLSLPRLFARGVPLPDVTVARSFGASRL